MANHDWGSPCDCSECRTSTRIEVCPHCMFENVVDIVGTAELSVDRKGLRSYDVTYPSGPPMALNCRGCHRTLQVAHYTSVNEERCAANHERDRVAKTARPCDRCEKRVEQQLGRFVAVVLRECQGQQLCAECLPAIVKAASPDPSDEDNKYTFNERALQWELSKVRRACERCGNFRWLSPANQWKRLCITCYRGKQS